MAAFDPSPAERLSESLVPGRTLAIGEVSAALGVTIDALRYYEAEGLLGVVERDDGGRRRYGRVNVLAVGVVQAMRGAGFGIEDVRALVAVKRPGAAPADLVQSAREQITELSAALDQRARGIEDARRLLAGFREELDGSGY